MSPGDLIGTPVGPGVISAAAALLVAFIGLRSRSRRVEMINRYLHEIRRPLQVLALALPESGAPVTTGLNSRIGREPVRQAISALSSLDREINGSASSKVATARSELVAVRLMADACVRRWLPFARLAGSSLRMVWTGPDVLVRGDGTALAAALENLIANAIEHGGSRVEVSGIAIGRKVRLEVQDSGPPSRSVRNEDPLAKQTDRLADIGGHGHGLEVVRSTISGHGGKFEAEFGSALTRAVIVLPVSRVRRSGVSGIKVNW